MNDTEEYPLIAADEVDRVPPSDMTLKFFSLETPETVNTLSFPAGFEENWIIGAVPPGVHFDNVTICGKVGTMSRKHAVISCDGERFYLFDNGSRNGTYLARDSDVIQLRGNRLRLIDGDIIGAGDLIMMITINNEPSWSARPSSREEKEHLLSTIRALAVQQADPQSIRAVVRHMIDDVFKCEVDFESFVIDYFFEVKKRFSTGMERKQKENLLLELADPNEILSRLQCYLKRL